MVCTAEERFGLVHLDDATGHVDRRPTLDVDGVDRHALATLMNRLFGR
jgi:hypothetical protein